MKLTSSCLLRCAGTLLLAWAHIGHATPTSQARQEIEALLAWVEQSPCTTLRNGKKHTAKAAVAHMRDKFEYFEKDVTTAEDFIRKAATQSELTGRAYEVECPGQPRQASATWLLARLQVMRQGR